MTKKEMLSNFFKKNPCLQDVLQLYCDGHNRKGISKIRDTKVPTTKNQMEDIRKVFGVNSMARALVYGIHYEIITIRYVDE